MKKYTFHNDELRTSIPLKILRITKLIALLMTVGMMHVWALGNAQSVTLNIRNGSLEEAFKEIRKQTNANIICDAAVLENAKLLNVKVNKVSLTEALVACLQGQGLEFTEVENTIVIRTKTRSQFLLKGKVLNEKQEPMPGVSIMVKGTDQGTITDANGLYSLNLEDENQVLIFSHVGYLKTEITVNERTEIDVTLQPDNAALDEIVVIGYGTENRNDLTGSVASINTRDIKDQPLPNIADAIAGRLPGVLIQQVNGAPGNSPAIKIRGLGSITADNGPLIVLDGQPLNDGALNLINPNDIETIDVLKDASATAIYGSRGANGVIMVTTKRGKAGKAQFNFDYYTGIQEVTKKMDVLNAQQFAEFSKDAVNTAYVERVPGASINDPNSVRPPNLRYRYPRGVEFPNINFDDPGSLANYDYQDMIFRKAPISSYQLSASGGDEKFLFSVSGNYLKQDGIIKRSGINRYSMRANIDASLTNKIKVGISFSPTFTKEQRVNSDGHWSENGVINSALAMMPFIPIYQEDGTTYNGQVTYAPTYNWTGVPNPVANITEIDNALKNLRILGNTYVDIALSKKLNYRGVFGVDLISQRQNYYRASSLPLYNQLPPTPNQAFAYSSQNMNWVTNHALNYATTLGSEHAVEALLGLEAQQNDFESSQINANQFANDNVRTLNAGTITGGNSLHEQWALASYFSRVNYTFRNKYLFNASVRTDGSSRFGSNNRWGVFPSGSIGWRVSEEPFLQNITAVSLLKLRTSYGLTGNNAFGNYTQFSLVNQNNYALGNGLANGLATTSIGNDNLTWEKNKQFDAGVELGLFTDRIFFNIDYYSRITTDMLLSVQVPTLTGFSSGIRNIGKVENKGLEVAVTTKNLKGKLTWNTALNISFNRNKVIALGPEGDPIRSGTGVDESNITVVGEPMGNIYGYRQLGIFNSQAELDAYPHFATTRPGDVKYEDVNKDGIISADDRTILGNNQPDYIYGITNTFQYSGFSLSVMMQGVQGGEILNLSRRFYDNLEGNANQLTTVLNRWRSAEEPGDGVTPRANSRTTGSNNAVSSRWVESATYFRIRNITLAYNIPTTVLQRIKARSLRVYVGVQNAFTSSKYLGYNPEVSGYESPVTGGAVFTEETPFVRSPLTGGVDYGSYPVAKTYTVGINLGF